MERTPRAADQPSAGRRRPGAGETWPGSAWRILRGRHDRLGLHITSRVPERGWLEEVSAFGILQRPHPW